MIWALTYSTWITSIFGSVLMTDTVMSFQRITGPMNFVFVGIVISLACDDCWSLVESPNFLESTDMKSCFVKFISRFFHHIYQFWYWLFQFSICVVFDCSSCEDRKMSNQWFEGVCGQFLTPRQIKVHHPSGSCWLL